MYDVQKGDASKLTEKELGYLKWDISNLLEPETAEQTESEAKKLKERCPDGIEQEEEGETETEDYLSPTKPKKKKAKKKDGKLKIKKVKGKRFKF